jgi:hypothetical protein
MNNSDNIQMNVIPDSPLKNVETAVVVDDATETVVVDDVTETVVVDDVTETKDQVLDGNKLMNVPLYVLLNFKKIIDITIQRGAYKSEELSNIGAVYNELQVFINSGSDSE